MEELHARVFTFLGWLGNTHDGVYLMVTHTLFVGALVTLMTFFVMRNLKLVPGPYQNILEWFVEGMVKLGSDMMGEARARKYLPLAGTLALFIFVSNMIGILPAFEAPTSNINVTLTLALVVFLYYNFEGIRVNGFFHYFGHFMGPLKILAPLMFPIEIISHLSRIVSLSFRLFGNVKGDDMFLLVMLMLVPWIAPLPAFFMLLFFGLLQTFIFMILTYVYLAGAVMIEEENH
jgi:F-type H+-transporting ATPase subunit a